MYFKFTYEIFMHAYIQTDQIYPIPSYLIPLLIPTIFSHPTSCTLFLGGGDKHLLSALSAVCMCVGMEASSAGLWAAFHGT